MSSFAGPQTESLDYATTAARLSQDLSTVREYSERLRLTNSLNSIDQVAQRMREHRFTVAVVGEFKTGKSTFVNSLLGVDVLPTDVVPATATLNRLTYGLDQSIDVVYKDGHRQAIEFDKLKEFVTKEYVTTDLLETIDEVVVHHPAPYLLNNVDIIDTPGLNDDAAMTAVSLSVLPKTDAAILVISALSPFSDYTRQFLEERLLSSDLGRVIFLVSRIGQAGSDEKADRIINHIEQRIAQHVLDRAKRELGENSPEYEVYVKKIGKPRVFGIDSHDALQGILNHDQAALGKSRFPQFQNGLRRFLNEDRGAVVLQVPVNRILASTNEILAALSIRRQAAAMTLEEFYQKRDAAEQELNRVRERKRQDMLDMERKKAEATVRSAAALKGMDSRLKDTVRLAVNLVNITDEEALKGKPAADKIQSAVNIAIRHAAEMEADRAAAEVNQVVAEASVQLKKLSDDLEQTVKAIVFDFGSGASRGEKAGAAAIGVAGLLLGGGLGAVASVANGYQKGGLLGAATGGAVTLGGLYAAGLVAGMIGMPLTLPVMIGAMLACYFIGDKVTTAIFRGARAKNFKEKTIEATNKQIDENHSEKQMTESLRAYVDATFTQLTQSVSTDVDAVIDNTQRTLADLARQKERQDMLTESQQRDLDQMAERTKTIQANALAVNKMLAVHALGASL